jgi:cellulose synthase/poly-beta-1,6-N-acetylglucosamine synthase-like glycosyltransferase
MSWTDLAPLLAALTLLVWLGLAMLVMDGNRRLHRLASLRAPEPSAWPRVSVVVAARNEAATVERALPTMLALDYPDLEVIVVNDRSDDDTGAILDRLAATAPRLRVVHVRELPPGWIGKNHALHTGADSATGEWVLFTDADIHFEPDTLLRAIAYSRAHSLDHLAAVPHQPAAQHLRQRLQLRVHGRPAPVADQRPAQPRPRRRRGLQPRARLHLPQARRP